VSASGRRCLKSETTRQLKGTIGTNKNISSAAEFGHRIDGGCKPNIMGMMKIKREVKGDEH